MNAAIKLQQRAEAAEKLLAFLRKEVAVLERTFSAGQPVAGKDYTEEIERLQKENEVLKSEVEEWKTKLGAAQNGNRAQNIPSHAVERPVENQAQPTKQVQADEPKPKEGKKQKVQKENKAPVAKKEEKAAKPKAEVKSEEDLPVDVGRLDFRVGKILEARRHPDADSLYVEDVDLGEEKLRTVVSGLVKFVPLEEMQGRLCVFLCNLKPAKMRGVLSEAMVMCASTPDKVEILTPPPGSQIGDLVEAEGYTRQADPVLNPKKKIWETVAPDLKTNEEGVACYKGSPLIVPGKGKIASQTLKGVQVK